MVLDILSSFLSGSSTYFGYVAALCEPDPKLIYHRHPILAYTARLDNNSADLVLSGHFGRFTNNNEVLFKHELNHGIIQLSIDVDCDSHFEGKSVLHHDCDFACFE
jgi:hypothetical protein